MSLPDENLRSLKRTYKFMTTLLNMKKKDLVSIPIQEWRDMVYGCIKHYPFDYQLDRLYEQGSPDGSQKQGRND